MWLSNLLTMSVTWWCVARTKLYIYIFIQIYADSHLLLPKILFNIIWLSNLLTKSGSDEGYSRNERTWWRLFQKRADMMKVIPETSGPDEGYSRNERTWWRLFQKWADLMKVIPETSGPDEGYSRNERTWWRLFQKRADLMKVIPETSGPDEGYSSNERTWWRLFQKRVVCTKFDIYVFNFYSSEWIH
jgi:hypothetical protein